MQLCCYLNSPLITSKPTGQVQRLVMNRWAEPLRSPSKPTQEGPGAGSDVELLAGLPGARQLSQGAGPAHGPERNS